MRFFYGFIVLMCILSCKSKTSDVVSGLEFELHQKSKYLDNELRLIDTTNDVLSYLPLSVSTFVMQKFSGTDSINILYPLDGSCSFCIGEFLNLVQEQRNKECLIPIHALLTANDSSNVVYFFEKMNVSSHNVYIYNSVLSEDDYKSVNGMPIVVYKRKVINSLWNNY